jgi:RimJ/RimL family protein N-acetyltransferase
MLLSGDAEVFGLGEGMATHYVAREPVTHFLSLVGRPSEEAAAEALYRNEGRGVAICQMDDREHAERVLPEWRTEPADLHVLRDNSKLPEVPADAVRFVTLTEIMAAPHIPAELRDELKSASLWSEIAATIVDGRPVAFCYAASDTETLWDISADTLEPYRRHGYAAFAVTHMIHHMHRRRRSPVWGAEESNVASWSLARKLGFVPVDRLIVLRSPED